MVKYANGLAENSTITCVVINWVLKIIVMLKYPNLEIMKSIVKESNFVINICVLTSVKQQNTNNVLRTIFVWKLYSMLKYE